MRSQMVIHPDWNELTQSEEPAALLLQELGYKYMPSEDLEEERGSLREVVLAGRFSEAIKRLNPWISDGNIKKLTREIMREKMRGQVYTLDNLKGG